MAASVNSNWAPRGPCNRKRPSRRMRLRCANSISIALLDWSTLLGVENGGRLMPLEKVRQSATDASPVRLGSLSDQVPTCLKCLDRLRSGASRPASSRSSAAGDARELEIVDAGDVVDDVVAGVIPNVDPELEMRLVFTGRGYWPLSEGSGPF